MGDARGVKRPAASDEDVGVRDAGDRSRRARAAAPPADCIDLTATSPSPREQFPDPESDPHGLSAVAACVPRRGESGDPRVAARLRRSTPASNTTRLCSADFDTFTTIRKSDHGFGCGYRNLQTILSALARDPSLAPLLGGAARLRSRRSVDPGPDSDPEPAIVPTVSELQHWLEHAWSAGFDVAGAAQLGTLVGTREWIGATEVLTLLRFAGVRAEVSDFEGRGGGDLGDAVWEWAWRRFDRSEPTARGCCSGEGTPSPSWVRRWRRLESRDADEFSSWIPRRSGRRTRTANGARASSNSTRLGCENRRTKGCSCPEGDRGILEERARRVK